ncbi:hypothetical protein M9H77_33612 [Catharanthus roseus]|uniref:Uncharacterized protein n=1 Tax=Catharanthus roseus TaxID=4058 RepID=A0ACB9ZL04_CATRO|nr:hypothetical protein M9H77_33612 [Catharanthus roseus]
MAEYGGSDHAERTQVHTNKRKNSLVNLDLIDQLTNRLALSQELEKGFSYLFYKCFHKDLISPSLSPRQCPESYGAIHRGFYRRLPIRSPTSLTFRHWAGVSPHTWSYDFAETCGEPASSGFKWHFTPNHNSSADSSTSIGSNFYLVSPKLHPGHG